jgi:histone-lysine N-methyltransferase SETMAR
METSTVTQSQPLARKLMHTVFWGDSQGPVPEHYQERVLSDGPKSAIRIKRLGLRSTCVVLLHDNVRPHTAAHIAVTLRKLKFSVMDHPPYSPGLASSDYRLFGPLKEALKDVDSPPIKLGRTRCMRASLLGRKHSFLRAETNQVR